MVFWIVHHVGLLFVLVFTTKGCLTCVFAYFHGCGLSYGFIFVILLAFLPLLKISSIVEFIDCPICFSVIGELFICCYFELDNCSFVVTFHWTIHEDKIVIYLNPRLKLVSTSISKLAFVIFNHFCDSISNEWLARLTTCCFYCSKASFLKRCEGPFSSMLCAVTGPSIFNIITIIWFFGRFFLVGKGPYLIYVQNTTFLLKKGKALSHPCYAL